MNRPLLILIPSPLVLSRTYKELARLLSDIFEVHIAALPGTGLNSGQGRLWDDTAYAEYLHQTINKDISNIFIFGHSNSGTIAAKLSNLMPEKVSGLILADTTGMGSHSFFRTLMARALDGVYELKFTVWAGAHLLINVLFHPVNFFYQVYLSVKNDARSDFIKVSVPTFLMWGRRDHTVPLKDAEKLRGLIRESHLELSKTGSHDWAIANPEEFFRSIQQQLEQRV